MEAEPILSSHEAALILAFDLPDQVLSLEELTRRGEIELAQARSAVERLKLLGAIQQASEQVLIYVSLSEWGAQCRVNRIPELRLLTALAGGGPLPVQDLQQYGGLPPAEAGSAFGALKRSGVLALESGLARLVAGADLSEFEGWQALVDRVGSAGEIPLADLTPQERKWLDDRRLRPMFQSREVKLREYRLTGKGQELREQAQSVQEELSQLTPAMLQDGNWRGQRFRRYNIGLPPRLVAGYRNPYRRFLDQTRQTLLGLGFEEMRGSLLENEFWDMDALFMPQFHPAREIHDVYFVEEPLFAQEVSEPYLSNVVAAHEGCSSTSTRGWGYVFDRQRARRLILRSQGTAVSARALASHPKICGKYYSMARCFRYDAINATHAPDFIQIEGIVLSEKVTFRHLLGILMLFAREEAQAKEVKLVPDYYPFTEPSVQVHMRHPELG